MSHDPPGFGGRLQVRYTCIRNMGREGLSLTENISVCVSNGGILILAIIDWTIPMVYGLILMSLALYKAAEYWRMEAGLKGSKLVNVLIRDQTIYFVLAVSCCVFNIVEFKVVTGNSSLAIFFDQLGSPSFLCILGSRLFFNMKEAGKLGVNEGTSYRMKSVSNIEFEQPPVQTLPKAPRMHLECS
ncbi:uncharacterized protein FOMMEDRAFT_160533 [Fomitiporia mediterranea MF3/22]|uniref:uncharacterized protein n=1 Tax=Fomitiporia mediterranea (strain MF3/22) TaxID=694068 RepID=UPI00044082A4|nr:uncharacterized protein FOMMEDRAFT_160533 [Fomitiporia mediterranea MF3/22]EJC99475.1 hypothetical protein FOMMEDRAFT_160533 [Fomitiporia mediterranea MF3/22]